MARSIFAEPFKTTIDDSIETLIEMRDVPNHLPQRRGRKINLSTIYRWTTRGIAGVRLESIYRGGIQFTSEDALRRFDDRVTAAKNGPRQHLAKQPSAKALQSATARALKKLAKH